MQNKEKVIKFREYLESVKYVSFCDIEGAGFCVPNCSITVYKKLKECKQSIEDFLIQFLLTAVYDPDPSMLFMDNKDDILGPSYYKTIVEYRYISKEIISVDEEKMTPLPKMLLNTEVGGDDIFIMKPMDSKDIDEFKMSWLGEYGSCAKREDDIKKFGFDIEKLTNRYLLSETASLMDILIYAEDEEYVYLLDGGRG